MRVGRAALVSLLLTLLAGTTHADGSRVELRRAMKVVDADSCIHLESIATRVEQWLATSMVDSRIRIQVVTQPSLGFEVRRLGKLTAIRRFRRRPASCDDRRDALALAIALAIDHTLLESLGLVPERTAEGHGVVVSLFAGGLGFWNVMPNIAAGGQLGVAIRAGAVLEPRMAILTAVAAQSDLASGAFDARLDAGRLDVCVGPTLGRIRPQACPGVLVGRVRADGRDFDRSLEASLAWVAASLGAHMSLRLGASFALEGEVAAVVPVVRPRYDVVNTFGTREFARHTPAAGMVGALGLRWSLR